MIKTRRTIPGRRRSGASSRFGCPVDAHGLRQKPRSRGLGIRRESGLGGAERGFEINLKYRW